MKPIEVTDEGLFDASPAEVFSALMDEAMGRSQWWHPALELHPRPGPPPTEVGSLIDVRMPGPPPLQFTERVTELVENRRVRTEYIRGDFLGGGVWTFEPVGERTRVRYRVRLRPNTWKLKLVRPFVNIGQKHSAVVQRGFTGLRDYLAAQQQPTLPPPSPGTTIETGAHL